MAVIVSGKMIGPVLGRGQLSGTGHLSVVPSGLGWRLQKTLSLRSGVIAWDRITKWKAELHQVGADEPAWAALVTYGPEKGFLCLRDTDAAHGEKAIQELTAAAAEYLSPGVVDSVWSKTQLDSAVEGWRATQRSESVLFVEYEGRKPKRQFPGRVLETPLEPRAGLRLGAVVGAAQYKGLFGLGDYLVVTDEGIGWGITTPGSGNPNPYGFIPWQAMQTWGTRPVNSARGELQIRAGDVVLAIRARQPVIDRLSSCGSESLPETCIVLRR
jgi:hypothetical protein